MYLVVMNYYFSDFYFVSLGVPYLQGSLNKSLLYQKITTKSPYQPEYCSFESLAVFVQIIHIYIYMVLPPYWNTMETLWLNQQFYKFLSNLFEIQSHFGTIFEAVLVLYLCCLVLSLSYLKCLQ